MGMGGAFVAIADDAESNYWNPAGLSRSPSNQILFSHNQWFQDIAYESVMGVHQIGANKGIGFNLNLLHVAEMERRYSADDIEPVGTFDALQFSGNIGYSQQFGRFLSLGATVNFLQMQIDNATAMAFGSNLGALLDFESAGLTLGASLRHLGTDAKYLNESFKMPTQVDVGVGYQLIQNMWLVSGDIGMDRDENREYRAGTELNFNLGSNDDAGIAIRSGYKYRSTRAQESSYFAGAGLRITLPEIHVRLDYAFEPFGPLGDTHRVSLGIARPGHPTIDCHAQPESFYPDYEDMPSATVIHIRPKRLKNIRAWRLHIYSDDKQLVENIFRRGQPPAHVALGRTGSVGRSAAGRTLSVSNDDRNRAKADRQIATEFGEFGGTAAGNRMRKQIPTWVTLTDRTAFAADRFSIFNWEERGHFTQNVSSRIGRSRFSIILKPWFGSSKGPDRYRTGSSGMASARMANNWRPDTICIRQPRRTFGTGALRV